MTVAETARVRERPVRGWAIVLAQELRDLWLGGRALLLCLGFSALLGTIAYLVATNTDLNFLERREAVSLTLQVATAVGGLLALLAAADAISGERERGTLETVLLTPVSRREIAVGKLLASLSLWLAAFVITIPYVWFLGRGIDIARDALAAGFVVGTLLAVFLAALGMLISLFSSSNRFGLSLSLFLLLALFAPTQLPTQAEKGWAGDLLIRLDPMSAGEHYIGKLIVSGHSWTQRDAAPVAAARRDRAHGGSRDPERSVPGPAWWWFAVRRRLAFLAAISALALAPSAPAADAAGDISVKVDRAYRARDRREVRVPNDDHEQRPGDGARSRGAPERARPARRRLRRPRGLVDKPDEVLDPIPAGGSTSVTWGGQAVNSGRIGLYVAVLDRSGTARPPAMGSTIRMDVTARRNLNAGAWRRSQPESQHFLALLTLGVSLSRRRFRRDEGS